MLSYHLLSLFVGLVISLSSMSTLVVGHSNVAGVDAIELLAKIMAAGRETTLSAKEMARSVKCIERAGWSNDLTLARLKDMITIFTGEGYVPSKTYIFIPDQCPRQGPRSEKGQVYISGNGNHAEDYMLGECGLVDDFYLTSSPCPDCAMELFQAYARERLKPTIHIARYYQGKGKTGKGSKDANKLCLAMLVQAGFKLEPWDWTALSRVITDRDCDKLIEAMSQLDKRELKTALALKEVFDMAKSGANFHIECNRLLKG